MIPRKLEAVQREGKNTEETKSLQEKLDREYDDSVKKQQEPENAVNILTFAIIGVLIPFSFSALIVIIWENIYVAKISMALGFVFLIVGVPLIVLAYRKYST